MNAEILFKYDVSSGKQVLFGDVERLARNVASGLAKRGFKMGDTLFYACHDTVNFGILLLVTWMLGGATRGNCPNDQPGKCFDQAIFFVKKSNCPLRGSRSTNEGDRMQICCC